MLSKTISSLHPVRIRYQYDKSGIEPLVGDASSSAASTVTNSEAGAVGPDRGTIVMSKGAIIAICVIGACVCIFGAISAILYFHAQKKDWKLRENFLRSMKRLTTALTPQKLNFPGGTRKMRSSWGLTKIEEMPISPKNQGWF